MHPTVFLNDHFVVVDKPSGYLSVPSRWGDKDERPCLGKELEKQLNCRLWPIHRLDFEVSGLTLFAKTAEAHKVANRWFEKRFVNKTYQALSEGTLSPSETKEFLWKSKILRGKKRSFESPHGDPAETKAHWLGADSEGCQQWLLFPLTGRPHQLRFELSRRGYPIVGDKLYGATKPFSQGETGIALRAVTLDFKECEEASSFELPPSLTVPGFF